MHKALKAKDKQLEQREKQIASLLEANRTLGNGLDELQSLPNCEFILVAVISLNFSLTLHRHETYLVDTVRVTLQY